MPNFKLNDKPSKLTHCLTLLTTATLLSACVSTASLQRDAEASALSRDSLPAVPQDWSSIQQRVGQVQVGWLAAYNDDLLNRLVAEAQQNNRNLQIAAANVDGARALSNQAASSLSPQLNLTGGSGRSGQLEGTPSNKANIGLQASWELDVWGRIRSGKLAANQSLAAAEADYVFAQYSMAGNIARAYFVALEADQQLDISQRSIDTLNETNRIVQVQFDNGMGDQQNLSLAKSDLASAQDALAASQGARRDAIRALEILLGRYPGADLAVGKSLPAVPPAAPAGLPSEILERRPDLIAAERRIAAAFNRVDQAKAAKLPSLSLSGSLGGASNSLGSILDPVNVAWQAISSIAAPLIDGGRIDAQVASATAEQKAAVASYAQTALNAFSEVETALDQGVVLRERNRALEVSLKAAEEALRIANLQFKEGEISLLDVLSIQQRVFSARRSFLSINRALLSQYVDLNLALGGAWE